MPPPPLGKNLNTTYTKYTTGEKSLVLSFVLRLSRVLQRDRALYGENLLMFNHMERLDCQILQLRL
jgi:hypothetical protein